jgi:hypothetical protein
LTERLDALCAGDDGNLLKRRPLPTPHDRLQVIAYAAMVAEHSGQEISEGRIRYHADNAMVRVPIDAAAFDDLKKAIARARVLQGSIERPPVTDNERLCVKCSLAPVCLPEKARLASMLSELPLATSEVRQLKLFPAGLYTTLLSRHVSRSCLERFRT